MKVLHLMAALRPSGMERMFVSAAPYLASVNSIIIGQGGTHPFAPALVEAGYRVEAIPSLKSLQGIGAWRRVLRRERPDVVHIHTEGAFLIAVLVAKFALPGARIVRTIHNAFSPRGKALLSRRLQGAFADWAVARFIAVSPDVRENERRFRRNAKVIMNWVEDRFFILRAARTETDRGAHPAAIIVGNSSPIKNQIVALRAVAKSDLDLYFFGDESGASADEIAILNDLYLAKRLRHRGVGDPGQSLVESAVFLMSSLHEGMSIALAEAITVGVPVILNDVPGQRWAIGCPNVTMIQNDQQVWDREVAAIQYADTGGDLGTVPIDLSARRGANELLDVWTSVLGVSAP